MKKIKKILLLLLVCVTLGTLTGCGEENIEGKLSDLMASIYEDVYADIPEEERPMLATTDALNPFEDATQEDITNYIIYSIGTKDIDYKEIYVTEPMMGSIAHSVVLVRMKDGANIEEAKKEIKENVNPRKWVCVGVPEEEVIVKSRGDLIILIMVEDETARTRIEKGFDNL